MGRNAMDHLYAVLSHRWPAARDILDKRLSPTSWRVATEMDPPSGSVMLAFRTAEDRQLLHEELEAGLRRTLQLDPAAGLRALTGDGIRLQIAAASRAEGWLNYAAVPGPQVDHVGPLHEYSLFRDNSVAAISCVHVLMQLPQNGTVLRALSEFHRILEPGGRLHISVPDLALLFRMFVEPGRDAASRQGLLNYIFGTQAVPRELHRTGFDEVTLRALLTQCRFVSIERVGSFGMFADASEHRYQGQPISLNIIAEKAGREA